MPNVNVLLRDLVGLNADCIDRLYLNGYIPQIQRPQSVWWYLHVLRGNPVVSPVLLKKITDSFVARIHGFAQRYGVPIVRFEKGARKEDIARKHMQRLNGQEGVVCVGVAQERVSAFRATNKHKRRRDRTQASPPPCFSFYRGSVDVNQYYFYILDRDFGLCFIEFSSYFPFGVRVWLNGHEWAKRQLDQQGVSFIDLDNGFFACDDPASLTKVCASLGPEHIDSFFRKWLAYLPHPFSREDRRAGLRYQLSILQMEVSNTKVFQRPLHGRQFFEEVIRDNLDLGRPDRVQLLFQRRITRRTPGRFRTRVITAGVQPSIHFDYKRTKVKQYFKLERALRTETTFNDTKDFGIGRSLANLPRLFSLGRNINHRLLNLERTAQHCAVTSRTVERIVLPTIDQDQRSPALRWGDPRTMALFSALCIFVATPEGLTNRLFRNEVSQLYDPGPSGYSASKASYDLRRLRKKGIISRVPRTHRYMLTPTGRRIAFFMTKSYVRVVRPMLHRLDPSLPEPHNDSLRLAWAQCEHAIDTTITEARMVA